ncbi:hypothetical protein GGTG_11168 [Gaeumannomyces tritici R3-111a-1]|uniref:Uncharacterized protein n=1 Tax=Gaeumannomyces tritici (strain R3-111a-1) TaxID=644352 RepID=J3PCE5_GAET3|nr:hypothetical protein GGTG_11168 [Gaeumannomyces tritici R3-111a-1]EJT71915.1 hypothetical protein GGTG_11168 [Gaeumannomyces tritici R3-111a-1]
MPSIYSPLVAVPTRYHLSDEGTQIRGGGGGGGGLAQPKKKKKRYAQKGSSKMSTRPLCAGLGTASFAFGKHCACLSINQTAQVQARAPLSQKRHGFTTSMCLSWGAGTGGCGNVFRVALDLFVPGDGLMPFFFSPRLPFLFFFFLSIPRIAGFDVVSLRTRLFFSSLFSPLSFVLRASMPAVLYSGHTLRQCSLPPRSSSQSGRRATQLGVLGLQASAPPIRPPAYTARMGWMAAAVAWPLSGRANRRGYRPPAAHDLSSPVKRTRALQPPLKPPKLEGQQRRRALYWVPGWCKTSISYIYALANAPDYEPRGTGYGPLCGRGGSILLAKI